MDLNNNNTDNKEFLININQSCSEIKNDEHIKSNKMTEKFIDENLNTNIIELSEIKIINNEN